VRLVNDDGEAPVGQVGGVLQDDRELLKCGDDDGLAVGQRLLELARGLVDVLHHARHLLVLLDGALELAVEDATIGDDDDGIEDAPVGGVVQDAELITPAGDGYLARQALCWIR
jgi:hypothetical protein